jgi:hypothetical protein
LPDLTLRRLTERSRSAAPNAILGFEAVTLNRKDLLAGMFFVACGGFFCFRALVDLSIGTALRMGSGYFPIMLGIVLMGLGAAIALKSIGMADIRLGSAPWRAIGLIVAAPVIFAVTVRGLGFAPANALAVFAAAFASRRMTPLFAALVAVGLAVFSVLVFKIALGLPLKTFGPWLGG